MAALNSVEWELPTPEFLVGDHVSLQPRGQDLRITYKNRATEGPDICCFMVPGSFRFWKHQMLIHPSDIPRVWTAPWIIAPSRTIIVENPGTPKIADCWTSVVFNQYIYLQKRLSIPYTRDKPSSTYPPDISVDYIISMKVSKSFSSSSNLDISCTRWVLS